MDILQDYFLCDSCQCKDFKRIYKDFKRIYNFSLRFHGVNFSDDLIYDKLIDEIYQCIECHKTFTKNQIENRLAEFKQKRKREA